MSPDASPADTRTFLGMLFQCNESDREVRPPAVTIGGERMSTDTERTRVPVDELADRCRGDLVPLTNRLAYFTAVPMAEEDLRQYLHDPIAALPPAIGKTLPKLGILLVPYLEKGNGKHGDMVSFERPAEARSILTAVRRTGGNV